MIEILNLTLKDAKYGLEKKKYSSVELTNEVFNQIEMVDSKIKAFISLTKDKALEAAKEFDSGKSNSNIAGVPGSVKDIYNWEGTVTTASSNIIKDYKSPYTATVMKKILEAGGVIVGKTNMDAFAHGSSTATSDFFPSRNPWDISRLPGGSSGGSAAAVASGMGIYSIGTETAGSIRQPAAWCGLTGIAPTYGRASRYGVIAMGSSLDRPGPIAKTIEDCALILDVIAGYDPKDATSVKKEHKSFTESLSKDIKGLRIGIPKLYFNSDNVQPDVIQKIMEAVKEFEKLGAKLVEIDLIDPKYSIAVYTIICRSEISSNLAKFDGIRFGYKSEKYAEDILDQISINRGEGFGNEAKRRIMTGTYTLSAGYYDAYYKKAQQVRQLIKSDMDEAFKKVDVIIGPTSPSTALNDEDADDPMFGEMSDVLVEASALSGLPALNIPVGFDRLNLPIGMNIMGPLFEEQKILNTGFAYQNVTDWHTKHPDLSTLV